MTPRSGELRYSGVELRPRRWAGPIDSAQVDGTRAIVLVVAWAALTGLLIAAGLESCTPPQSRDSTATSPPLLSLTGPLRRRAMKAVTWLGCGCTRGDGEPLGRPCSPTGLPMVALVLAVIAWAGENGGVRWPNMLSSERTPKGLRLVSAHGWSWPSGHTAVALLVSTILALVIVAVTPTGLQNAGVGAGGVAVAAVAFSRIELGVHWTTDVVAAFFVSAWLVASWLVRFRYSPEALRRRGRRRRRVLGARRRRAVASGSTPDPPLHPFTPPTRAIRYPLSAVRRHTRMTQLALD